MASESTLTYRISTGLLWVIVIQMFGIVWWIASYTAKADERLKVLEEQQTVLSLLPERLARQEQQMSVTNQTLRDIRDDLRAYNHAPIRSDNYSVRRKATLTGEQP